MVLRKLIVGIKRKMILIPRALSSITLQLTEKTQISMIRVQIESIPLARRAAVFANQLQSPLVVRQNRAGTEIINPRPLVAPIAVAGETVTATVVLRLRREAFSVRPRVSEDRAVNEGRRRRRRRKGVIGGVVEGGRVGRAEGEVREGAGGAEGVVALDRRSRTPLLLLIVHL